MALLNDIPEDRGYPIICGVGNGEFENKLRDLLNQIDGSADESIKVIYLDVNSSAGSSKADLYELDLNKLPFLLIIEDDDTLYKKWNGDELPDVHTVIYEIQSLTGSAE